MRIGVNKAGKRVQVRWKDESFECAVSANPGMTDSDRLVSFALGTAECAPRRRALRPLGMVTRRIRGSRAFTIIELLVVIAIIGLLAALALPHLGGFGKSNSMTAATRQVLDDVAYARQRALLDRTTVYMVFLPPSFWNWGNPANTTAFGKTMAAPNMTNLITGQYTMYALLSLHSVGDQPGHSYPKYLTQWRRLPEGVTIAQEKFFGQMFVNDTNSLKQYLVNPFATNLFPFPSIESFERLKLTSPQDYFRLPCIAFGPNGSLTTNQDEYIPLTRASVFYPQDASGNYILNPPDWAEVPPGTSTNDYHLIHINWLTGRARLERKEIQ